MDKTYSGITYNAQNIDHNYGENVHLLNNPHLLHLLSILSQDQCTQPTFTTLVRKSYQLLLDELINLYLVRAQRSITTRMQAPLNGELLDLKQKVVSVDLARAGMVPSQEIYEHLNYLLPFENLRQDHFYAARVVNDQGHVIGTDISGSKIGGPVENATVIFPDPMGATGGTIVEAVNHYKNNVEGRAKNFIALHLIVTPEYIQRIKKDVPEVKIIAGRLDRGLSSKKALSSPPGTYPEEERGLNESQYIVPGAGGIGELLNQSFV